MKFIKTLLACVFLCGAFLTANIVTSHSALAGGGEAAAEGEEGAEKLGFGFDFVKLDPLILPIVDKNGVSQTVSLVIAIEVSNQYQAEKVRLYAPRLKDAFIQEMYGMLNRHAAMKGGVLQVKMLKDKLRKISFRVLGEDTANDVLLQVVQQRQL